MRLQTWQVGKLRALVEQVAHVAGVDLNELDEYQALLQLQHTMRDYVRWRLSQVVIEKKLDPKARLQKAASAVRGLLAALEAHEGSLVAQSPDDASNESLEYLLRSAASLAATGPLHAGAADEPPKVQRIPSAGFKAPWADVLLEEEIREDENEREDVTRRQPCRDLCACMLT